MKIVKTILITIGALIGLIVISFITFISVMMINPSFVKDETGQIQGDLYTVRSTMGNFYFYKNGDNWLCFDAGDDIKNIPGELEKLNIDPAAISHVFLTHSDQDHIAGIPLFINAVVFLPALEEQMINGETTRFPGVHNKLPTDKYVRLNDGESLTIDDIVVDCIATPGHTPGSMSFLINEDILITGDTLMLKNGAVEPFVRKFSMDSKTMLKSITKLARTANPKILCTGHTGHTTDVQEAFTKWRGVDQ